MSVERHRCPAPGCDRMIVNALFCCGTDWFRLSLATRTAIGKTAGMPLLSAPRRRAIEDAMREWRASHGR